jgi:dipeptidyl aminopeptidase/acylaminoacyl peptidase
MKFWDLGGALSLLASPLAAQTPASLPAADAISVTMRPVADFAALPYITEPRLSPDGKRIAAKLAVDGQQVLAILSVFEGGGEPFLVGLGDNQLNSWTWVNDDWLAIGIGSAIPLEGETFYVTRVAGVSAEARKVKPIAFKDGGQNARVIWAARDGTPRILMSMQKSIYVGEDFWPQVTEVDLSTGRQKPVQRGAPGVMTWIADPSGAVRMGIGRSDEGRASRLLYRSGPQGNFATIDRARSRDNDSLMVPILLAGPTGGAVTITQSDGRAALHEFDLVKLEAGKKLFSVDNYDIDGITLTPEGDAVAAVDYVSDRSRTTWLTPRLVAIQAQLDAAVGDRAATIVSMDRAQNRFLVHVGDASTPGSYYFYNSGVTGTMTRYAYVNQSIKGMKLGPVSLVRYKARDGMSIEAVLTLPKGRDPKSLPLIVLPHGGPEARDAAEYDWWTQFLADRGYAVIQPNYRGSTGYGAKLLEAGNGEWGLKMQDDLNDAVDYLAGRGMIDPKRVCIAGASYGGYAAMRAAQRDGPKFRCAISYAGVADLNGMIRYDTSFLNGGAMRDSWRQSAPDLKAVSPVDHAAEFGAPILIMHGKKDLRVPVAQSRRMADRLAAAGKAVVYIEQPLGDHHFSRQADRLQFLEAMESFLAKHNPA